MFQDIITDPLRYIAPVFAEPSQVSYRKSADSNIRPDSVQPLLNNNHSQYLYRNVTKEHVVCFYKL